MIPHQYPRDYYPDIITDADRLFHYFSHKLDRKSYPIRMFGKTIMQPRLVSFVADIWLEYTYSQTNLFWDGRDTELALLRDVLNKTHHLNLNSVLCNLYRDGNDSMWRHSDDETELWSDPVIVSVTLWESRVFKMRHKQTKETVALTLTHGSVLVMTSGSQIDREHCIPKTSKILWPRVNLTFRKIC
jgi:alkylated DNA repair dioxygenase AlkB